MTDTNTARTACNACDATGRPATGVQRADHLGLTRGERVVATATAAAILLSGANGLVQMVRVLVQCWLTPG